MKSSELKELMSQRGWNPEQLAELLDRNVRTIRRWLDAEVPIPNEVAFILTAGALDQFASFTRRHGGNGAEPASGDVELARAAPPATGSGPAGVASPSSSAPLDLDSVPEERIRQLLRLHGPENPVGGVRHWVVLFPSGATIDEYRAEDRAQDEAVVLSLVRHPELVERLNGFLDLQEHLSHPRVRNGALRQIQLVFEGLVFSVRLFGRRVAPGRGGGDGHAFTEALFAVTPSRSFRPWLVVETTEKLVEDLRRLRRG